MHTFTKSDILRVDSLNEALAALAPARQSQPSSLAEEPPLSARSSSDSNANRDSKAQDQDSRRQKILTILQQTLTDSRDRLHQNHLKGSSGHAIAQGHAYVMDTLLRSIYHLVNPETTDKPGHFSPHHFSLIATGGYGRGELAPYSDIDLLFLLPTHHNQPLRKKTASLTSRFSITKPTSSAKPASPPADTITDRVEQMLYYLWDLRLDVGHAVRTIDECVQLARQNVEIRTSMLESRFLNGDPNLFKEYYDTLFAKVLERGPEAFLRDKLLEQTKRHKRFGHSLFYLEPNVKENPGGLRDLQTFSWISKYRYQVKKVQELVAKELITQEEYNTFTRCNSFLKRVRNALHYRAGRREDRLTFQHQIDIANEFGYKDRRGQRGVEQFMRRYYKVSLQVGNLSWIFLRKYQEEHQRLHWWNRRQLEECFELHGDKVIITDQEAFRNNPVCLMKLFEVGQRHLKSIHPDTLRMVTQNLRLIDDKFRKNPLVTSLFLKMLNGETAVAWVLRRMSISGMLGRFIPEFGRIIGQTQYDLFHVYTVDEHTIQAVEALRHIKSGKFSQELPICTTLMAQLKFHNKGAIILYLAVLLHDIAKGHGGDHQLKGAVIATQVCLRLGLSESATGLVSWLVGRHLLFSRTAFHRDISDPETISQFARQIGTQKRLEFLLLLTVADIRAVGPGVWNLWKANLLRRLYNLTLEAMKKGAFQPEELAQQAKDKKATVLRMLTVKKDSFCIRAHLDRFEDDYFLHYEAETIAKHTLALIGKEAEYERQQTCQETGPLEPLSRVAVIFLASPISDTTELLIYAKDQSGLMARISGALAIEGVNILSADITTSKDGMALDVFVVQNAMGKALEEGPQLIQLEQKLTQFVTNPVLPPFQWHDNQTTLQRRSTFDVPLSIHIDDSLDIFTILEVTSLDRVGLLFTITREIERHGIQIRTAKITTYGERAVDVFYVRNLYGFKLTPQIIAKFTGTLHKVLQNLDQERDHAKLSKI